MWSWSPPTTPIDPSGSSVVGGVVYSLGGVSDCYLDCVSGHEVYLTLSGLSECYTDCLGGISGYGTREGSSENITDCVCDVGNGLTVRKGTSEVRNTNLLEFQGNLTFSGSYGKALLNILAGSGDAAVTYATRIDFVDSTTMYKGEAAVGTADGDVAWRISKYVFGTDSDVTVTWASGNDTFDKVWNNRASLSYS